MSARFTGSVAAVLLCAAISPSGPRKAPEVAASPVLGADAPAHGIPVVEAAVHPRAGVGALVHPSPSVGTPARRPPMAEGPPAGFTGGFGEGSCIFCHTGSDANAFGGEVRVEGLPEMYDPGGEYILTVILRADETSTAGFQMSARFLEGPKRGTDAGVLAPLDARTARTDSAGVAYLHQSPDGSVAPDPSGSSWTFAWSAPESRHPVAIHVAANSGNGDESPLGDLVYTDERLVPGRS